MDWSRRLGAGCDTAVEYDWLTSGDLALTCGGELELLDAQRLESVGTWRTPANQQIRTVTQGPSGDILVLAGDRLWSLSRSEIQAGAAFGPDPRFGRVSSIVPSRGGGSVAVVEDTGGLWVLPSGAGPEVLVADSHKHVAWVSSDTLAYCTAGPAPGPSTTDLAPGIRSRRGLFVWSLGNKQARHLATPDLCEGFSPSEDVNWLVMGSYRYHVRTGARTANPVVSRAHTPVSDPVSGLEDCLARQAAREGVWCSNGDLIRPTPRAFGIERVVDGETKPLWVAESNEPVARLKLSPDGNHVVGRCGPEEVCAWDTFRGLPVRLAARSVPETAPVLLMSGSQDGAVLLSASRHGDVAAWDLESGTMARLEGALLPLKHSRGLGQGSGGESRWQCFREAGFSAHVAVARNGGSAAFTSRSITHVFHRSLGTWSKLQEARDGAYVGSRFVFAHRKSWLVVDRPDTALRHAELLTARANSSADRVVASADQLRFAIDTGLRSSFVPEASRLVSSCTRSR